MSSAAVPNEPAGPLGDGGLVRVRLDLAYDGTDFAGWARQPAQRTVQGTLAEALVRVLRLPAPPALVVAGRTDAGVHATGQVAHLDLPAAPDEERLRRGLNGTLPPDVRVRRTVVAPAGFDARFAALSRRYTYRVTDTVPDPLRRHDTLAWSRPLDLTALRQASAALLGEHDFAAFCRRREGATTVRQLLRFDWERDADAVLVATVEADAFCHSMVRALVGAALAVGEGRKPASWPATVLAGRVRNPGVLVAPAHGLTLREVRYPAEDQLAARALLTRRRRDEPPAG